MIQIYKPENDECEKNGDMTLLPTTAMVHAVLNGEWEATLEHPIDKDGRWKYIVEDAVVKLPSFNGDQLFRIKKKEKSDGGITAEMQPIFMDAKDDCFLTDVRPTEKTGQQALDIMTAPNKKYSAKSNIAKVSTAYYQTKNLIEAIGAEDENSFINRWGGEVIYDNYTIVINDRAGSDYGYEVMYGKNIPENGISEEIETRDIVTRIVPKAYNGHMIEGDEPWVDSPEIDKYPTIRYGVMEFEDVKMREDAREGDEEDGIIVCDTQAQLEEALKKKCEEQFEAGVDKPTITLSVDIVMIEGTDLYEDFEDLTKVSIGDTVHCRHSKLDIVTDARVIELEWDCLEKRVDSVVVGEFQYNYIDETTSMMNRVESAIRPDGSVIGQQVQGIINGVKAQLKAQSDVAKKSKVRAALFEDLDPDSPTFGAMCLGTMGFEIASERTADGRDWDWKTFGTGAGFFADFIVAGTMLADRIHGGTLILGGDNNADGVAKVLDAEGKEIVRLSNEGVYANGKYVCESDEMGRSIEISEGEYKIVDADGNTVGRIFAPGNEWMKIEVGDVGIRMSSQGPDNKAVYIDTDNFGINGYNGKTGRIEFSDGTYIDLECGVITGGNTKEGTF